jgi:DNA (cytosine-5)-methyltransferase 1
MAFLPLGVKAAWFAEIEPAPCSVLAHRWPTVPNLGDMTLLPDSIEAGQTPAPDIFMGGTPCQAFSVAGKRASLADRRGNLTLTFVEIANAIDAVRHNRGQPPAVIFWENVPGVLNTKDNAFGCFLGGLAGEDGPLLPPGGRWTNAGCVFGPTRTVAWRVLDAQYFGVPQRRRRVYVVSGSGSFDPCAVLFESEGVRRDSAPSREAREGAAGDAARCTVFGGNNTSGPIDVAPAVNANRGCHNPGDFEAVALCVTGTVTHALKAEGADASEDGTGRGTPIVAFPAEMSGTQVAASVGVSPALSVKHTTAVASTASVRRLTPIEAERLMGWPDNHTLVPHRGKPMADGPRYKIIGNGWALPCVAWIAKRIVGAAVSLPWRSGRDL